jgi:hypothetical protein
VRPPVVRDEYFAQLDQRLHNVLAAATSLVDHTRRLVAAYPETSFAAELARRNNIVRDDPASSFLRDLRNYLLHVGVAPFRHMVRFPDSGVDAPVVSEIYLDTAGLLSWSGWKAGSKEYLAGAGDSVRLIAAVNAYVEAMSGLYDWVFEQFEQLHGEDIDAANALVAQFNLTLTGGVTDARDWRERMAALGAGPTAS